MKKEPISCEELGESKPHLSHAIATDNLIFCSGQVPVDPETEKVVQGGIEKQTKQIFKNLEAILKSANSNLQKVVKVTVFLTDIDDYYPMTEVYSSFFPKNPPARSVIEVGDFADKDYKLEIELIANK